MSIDEAFTSRRCCVCLEGSNPTFLKKSTNFPHGMWVRRHVRLEHRGDALCRTCAFKWNRSCPLCRAEPEVLRAEITKYVQGLSSLEVTAVVALLGLEDLKALYNEARASQ